MFVRIYYNATWNYSNLNKNDNNYKNEVQDIRWSDEYWQVENSCKYYRISYYIKINLTTKILNLESQINFQLKERNLVEIGSQIMKMGVCNSKSHLR